MVGYIIRQCYILQLPNNFPFLTCKELMTNWPHLGKKTRFTAVIFGIIYLTIYGLLDIIIQDLRKGAAIGEPGL